MAWMIVGLGNPGEEYEGTRHNTGRMMLEYFARNMEAPDWKPHKASRSLTTGTRVGTHLLALILPNSYMNKSGASVATFVKSAKAAERLVVVYDDLDLPLGKLKISFDRGSGGHKGVESIIKALKTKKFVRLRIGISPETPSGQLKKPRGDKEVERHILGRFKTAETEILKRVFRKGAEAIETIVTHGVQAAMNRFN